MKGYRGLSTWSLAPLIAVLVALLAACGQQNGGAGTASPTSASVQASASAGLASQPAAAEASSPAVSMAASASAGASPTGSAAAASAVASPPAVVGEGEFQNPVLKTDFPDPFLLKEGDTYYAYATNGQGKNVQVARSTDLVKWEGLADAMPVIPKWAKPNFTWAPEVIKIGDTFVIYYTARDKASDKQCVGVATSEKPEGKFKDTRDAPFVCQVDEGGTIDASPFRDSDGKLYLLFKNDGNCCGFSTYLYIQELGSDGLSLVGEPVRLVKNDKVWEGSVVEAPTMWKQEDTYYLFYSANSYAGLEYAVGYATCETPKGPCTDAEENPILKTALTKPPVIGPGHQTLVVDDDGETWLVYHAWEVASTGLKTSRRLMWIDRITWQDGKPDVQGPTTAPQPLP